MLGQRRRRWPNIKTTLDQCLVFAGCPRAWNEKDRQTGRRSRADATVKIPLRITQLFMEQVGLRQLRSQSS